MNIPCIKIVDRVENYKLNATNGRHIRVATKVVYTDGTETRFTEKMSRQDAIEQSGETLGFLLPLETILRAQATR